MKETQSTLDKTSKDDKRNCEEIRRRIIEIDELKSQVKIIEEREKLALNNYKYEADKLRTTNNLLENEKKMTHKYSSDLAELQKKLLETETNCTNYKNYGDQLQKHYETKKKQFEEEKATIIEANKNLELKLMQADRDVECLKDKVIHGDSRVRQLVEENNTQKEKIKTLTFQIDALVKQRDKDISLKQMNSTLSAGSLKMDPNRFNMKNCMFL